MKTRVQIVANSGFHKIPTVLISIYKTQFIFNIIPTLIRHRRDHKINLYNSAHIFFTKNSIQATGGLPNYLLFRHGVEHANSDISNRLYMYTDNQLYNYFQKLRFKLGYKILRTAYTTWDGIRNRLGVSNKVLQEFKNRQDLPNIYIKIDTLIRENYKRGSDYYTSTDFLCTNPTPYISIPCMYFHHDFMDIYPIRENKMDSSTTTSYICIPTVRKGQVDVNIDKFKYQSKINKEKLVQDFISNGFVKNEEGKIFKKRDYFFENDYKPQNIIIFHYTNKESALKIASNPVFVNYLNNKNSTCLVVHILQNLELLNEPQFHLLLESFSAKTKHYWYHRDLHMLDGDNMVYLSQLMIYHNYFPYLFRPSIFKPYNQLSQSFIELVSNVLPSSQNFFYKHLFHFIVNDFAIDRYQKRMQLIKPAQSKSDIILRLIQSQPELKKRLNSISLKQRDEFKPQLLFLGTASSLPTYNRNTLGILISFSQKFKILMDCGQGTLQQLEFGTSIEKSEEELFSIRVIFVTHIHSDHNLGILNIISERNKLLKARNSQKKLYLIIPFNVYNWFIEYCNKIEDINVGCHVIFTQILNGEEIKHTKISDENKSIIQKPCKKKSPFFKKAKPESTNNTTTSQQMITHKDLQGSTHTKMLINNKLLTQKSIVQLFNKELAQNNITTFQPIKAIHCPQSYGIIVANQKYKICYSGDTRPSKDFEKASLNCNLMIHESTYNDHEEQKAISHLHSTVSDALTVARNAKAEKLILTHFNEEFDTPATNKLSPSLSKYYLNDTIISFDHLNVPFDDMTNLPWTTQQIFRIEKQADRIHKANKEKFNFEE